MKSIVYSYSNDDFIQIVNESTSYAECMRKLGYKSISNDSLTVLKRRISELNLSIEHFINTTHRSVRTKENVLPQIKKLYADIIIKKFHKLNVLFVAKNYFGIINH